MAGEIAFGMTLAYSDTLNGTYTSVPKLVDIVTVPLTTNRVDKSHHGMTDPYREFTFGLGTAGEIDATIQIVQSTLETLITLLRVEKYWRTQLPLVTGQSSQGMWKCLGFLADIAPGTPIDDSQTLNLKIVLSGKPVFTAGS